MRLRIFDLRTPWFWIVAFFNRNDYGRPMLEFLIYRPNKWKRWWIYVWQWEQIPTKQAYAKAEAEKEE